MNTFKNKVVFILSLTILISCTAKKDSPNQKLMKVEKGTLIQRVTLSGNIVPARKAIITPSYNGYIKKIFVTLGQKVKEGDPLVTVSTSLAHSDQAFPLRAPFSGQVVSVNKSEGEYVQQNNLEESIIRIDDLSKRFIQGLLPELDRLKVKVGMEAVVKTNALQNKTFKARVVEINFSSKDQDRWNRSSLVEFPIRLEVLDATEELVSGLTCLVDVITAKKENILTLPHEFIHRKEEGSFVKLKSGETRKIEVGLTNEELVEVISGLSEGDEVQKVDFTEMLETNVSNR